MTAAAEAGGRHNRHELLAVLRWVLRSWLRPADHDSGWEQRSGHRLGLRSGTGGQPGGGRAGDSNAHQTTAATPQGH